MINVKKFLKNIHGLRKVPIEKHVQTLNFSFYLVNCLHTVQRKSNNNLIEIGPIDIRFLFLRKQRKTLCLLGDIQNALLFTAYVAM